MDAASLDIIFSYLLTPKDKVRLSLVSRDFCARYYYIALCSGFECEQKKLIGNLGSHLLTREESENIGLLAMMDRDASVAAARAFASSKLIEIGQLLEVATCAITGCRATERSAWLAKHLAHHRDIFGTEVRIPDPEADKQKGEQELQVLQFTFGDGFVDDAFDGPVGDGIEYEIAAHDPIIADAFDASTSRFPSPIAFNQMPDDAGFFGLQVRGPLRFNS